MTLIERLLTLRMFWPGLKECSAFSLLTLHKLPRPGFRNLQVITWQMDEKSQVQYMLTHIDYLAVKGQINLKLATKLVADQLGRLITLQVNKKERSINGNPTVAGLEETIRGAGGRLSKIPPTDPPDKKGRI